MDTKYPGPPWTIYKCISRYHINHYPVYGYLEDVDPIPLPTRGGTSHDKLGGPLHGRRRKRPVTDSKTAHDVPETAQDDQTREASTIQYKTGLDETRHDLTRHAKTAQYGPKTSQEGSKTAHDAPKTPQEAPKRPL